MGDNGRRKNATRETTATLKAWLNEHRKNPYPTKGEKIMLAIVSKMTLTQVGCSPRTIYERTNLLTERFEIEIDRYFFRLRVRMTTSRSVAML